MVRPERHFCYRRYSRILWVAAEGRFGCILVSSKRGLLRAGASLIFLLVFISLQVQGCAADVYLRTQQQVSLLVAERDSGDPVTDADIWYAERTDHPDIVKLSDSELLDSYGEPAGHSDSLGRLTTQFNTTRIVGGLWGKYDPKSDTLTGRPYVFRVRLGDRSEYVRLTMELGSQGEGCTCCLKILHIGEGVLRGP